MSTTQLDTLPLDDLLECTGAQLFEITREALGDAFPHFQGLRYDLADGRIFLVMPLGQHPGAREAIGRQLLANIATGQQAPA